ncbi:outer membrane protein, adhesin transport system [Desulfonatronum zhilinae]|nr:outer membrane protein, adhesin transport system [Desulfonatronum zhilinae]
MFSKRIFFLAFAVFLLCSAWPVSAFAKPFSVFMEEAVTGHDLVLAAQARRDAARAGVARARGEWMPHLDAAVNVGPEYVDPPGDRDSTTKTRDYQRVTAKQLLYDFGRSGAGIGRAQAAVERAEAEVVAARQEVMLQGIAAYLDVVRHKERLRLALESEQRIMDLTGIEETLVTRGAGLASDVLQAKSQLAGAKALRVRVEGQLALARNRFLTVFEVAPTDELLQSLGPPMIPFERVPAGLEEASAAAADSSVELLMARHNVDMARQDLAGSEADLFPRLHLVGEAKRKHNDQGVDGARNEALGMVELTWAVFSGGKERAAIREARSNLTDQERRVKELQDRVEERVAAAWQNLITTRENARLLHDQAEILEEFLDLAKHERLLGTRSLLDVLNGEVGHLNALSNAVSAETDRAVALYQLFFAMGRLDLDLF